LTLYTPEKHFEKGVQDKFFRVYEEILNLLGRVLKADSDANENILKANFFRNIEDCMEIQ